MFIKKVLQMAHNDYAADICSGNFRTKFFSYYVMVTLGVKRKSFEALYIVSNIDYQVTLNN
jgi:hypothetical protein